MAGNRDFLLGQDYADNCGMRVIQEPTVIDLYGEDVLLIHGDAECIDDLAYQKVRRMFRDTKWQQKFLNMPIEQRLDFAEKARQESQQHTKATSTEIMDVNQNSIDQLFTKHKVKTIIHGHTHRPAIHQSNNKQRIVLGDWHHQSSYLKVNKKGKQLIGV